MAPSPAPPKEGKEGVRTPRSGRSSNRSKNSGRRKKEKGAAEKQVGDSLTPEHMMASLSQLGPTDDGRGLAFRRAELKHLRLSDISLLSQYTHLSEVDLHNNLLTSLQPLVNARYLRSLGASKNHLSSTSVLVECSNAYGGVDPASSKERRGEDGEVLVIESPLVEGQRRKLNVIHPEAPVLSEVDLSGNLFSQMPRHDHLVHLRELKLDNNGLASLDGLASSLPSLTLLSVAHNRLENIAALSTINAPRLRDVLLDSNQIDDITPLGHLSGSLERLTLNYNEVMHISVLQKCSSLASLEMRANNLHRTEELDHLESVEHLQTLALAENPICFPPLPDMSDQFDEAGSDVVQPDNLGDDLSDEEDSAAAADLMARQARQARQSESKFGVSQTIGEHQRQLRSLIIAKLPQLTVLEGAPITAKEKVKSRLWEQTNSTKE